MLKYIEHLLAFYKVFVPGSLNLWPVSMLPDVHRSLLLNAVKQFEIR